MHAGVKIPKFEQLHTGGEGGTKLSLTGLGSGGQQIQTCRKAFINSIELLVQLASLQTAFLTLDVAIKTTNRRVNALDNVVRPKLENTISYIKVQAVPARQSSVTTYISLCSSHTSERLSVLRQETPQQLWMPDSSLLLMHATGVLKFVHSVQSGLLAYCHIVCG